jgi:hypothetical protein
MAPKGQKRSKANAFNPIAPIRNRTIEIAESSSSSLDDEKENIYPEDQREDGDDDVDQVGRSSGKGSKTKGKSVATNPDHGTSRAGESRSGKSKATDNDSGRAKRKRQDDDDDVDQMGRSPRKKSKTQGEGVTTNSDRGTERADNSRGGKSKATDNDTNTSNIGNKRKRGDDDDDVDQMGRPSRKKGKTQGKSVATNSDQGSKMTGDSRGGKRKATDDDCGRDERPQKKQKKQAKGRAGGRKGKKATGGSKKRLESQNKLREDITSPPKDILDNVYVFGANRKGELGLEMRDVREPILNVHLSGAKVGIVQIATGSSHCIALTHDNRILTWGYNLGGALGRGAPRDPDQGLQGEIDVDQWEYTPMEIPQEDFPSPTARKNQEPGGEIIFSQVAAGKMFSFALTNKGFVYGWGTFSVSSTVKSICLRRVLTAS